MPDPTASRSGDTVPGVGLACAGGVVEGAFYEIGALCALEEAVHESVRVAIGKVAKVDIMQVVPGLPKTRSGQVMRRILRKVAEGRPEELGDVSTLADPGVVAAIVDGARALKQRNP